MFSRPLVLAAVALLAACGGGGGGPQAPDPVSGAPPTPPPPTDPAPPPAGPLTIEAGYSRVVVSGIQVNLSATVTEGEATSIAWRQTAGASVTLDPIDSLTPSFTAPSVDSGETLSFEVTAQNSDTTGTFPNQGNPNTIQTVFQTWRVPDVPERTDTATDMATFGITLDGIKLERDTAESFRNEGVWRYEAITPGLARRQSAGARFEWLGTDCNNAHVQPTGAYHYHGLPEGLINRLGEGVSGATDMIAGGFAADGFPLYLRYGYRDPDDPQSGLVTVRGSWMLPPGTRPSGPGGPYDGTFRENWEYVEGSGDLDHCNGRFGVTPEHPAGTYHYYITDDYPYIPRCVFGTPDGSFRVRR